MREGPSQGRAGAPTGRTPLRASPKGARSRGTGGGVRIVHEDDDLMVVDKPAGLLTAGLPGQEIDSVFGFLKTYVRQQARRRGTKVWIIHRLDKEASGLLVFAKSDRAFEFLKEEFRSKRAHRLYAAVVEGEIADTEPAKPDVAAGTEKKKIVQGAAGTVQSFLIEDDRGIVHSVPTPTATSKVAPKGGMYAKTDGEGRGDHAKLAVTHWRAAATGLGRTLMQVRLETGRKNQIRVHMQEIKHPIVGDQRYGAATDPIGRVCLHAAELGFVHPANGQPVRFNSQVPEPFWKLVGRKPEAPGAATQAPALTASVQPSLKAPAAGPGAATSWDHVAEWYDGLIEDRKSDHHEMVILPGTLRLLEAAPGMRVLDLACGQGVLAHRLGAAGVRVVGLDASPRLIELAKKSAGPRDLEDFVVGDARGVGQLDLGEFDAAACVMALMNIEPLGPVLEGVASRLKPGGRFVAVMLHPAFRAPGQTSWGWEMPGKGKPAIQYRRVDGYLSPGQSEIVMNPGAVARGQKPVTTVTFHRPLQAYIKAFSQAGLLVDTLEEWSSLRQSEPGPRAAEENRARREVPMFVAIRGLNVAAAPVHPSGG